MNLLPVLMWKHLIVKKRRYILTTVDILSPIFFFVILFIFRDSINPVRSHSISKDGLNIDYPPSIPLSRISKPSSVLYSPDTQLVNLLMNVVKNKLDNTSRRRARFIPLRNETEFENMVDKMRFDDLLVIFHNLDGESWPRQLNYTIRVRREYMTHTYASMDERKVPHAAFEHIYQDFMSVQWAIDTAYLQLLTGKPVDLAVSLQEFPYVEHVGSDASKMVCEWLKSLCFLSLLLSFVLLMSRLLNERISGIQDLMRMTGVSAVTNALSHVLNILPTALVFSITGAALLTTSSNPLLHTSNGFLIFLGLLLYFLTIVAMAFVGSYLTNSSRYAVTLSVMLYMGLWLPASFLSSRLRGHLLLGLLPHVPLMWLWDETGHLEEYGQGLTWTTMVSGHSPSSMPVLAAYLAMILQSALWFLFAWYLDHVRPSPYGQVLPWNFVFKRSFWRKNDISPDTLLDDTEEPVRNTEDQQYFEPPPPNMDVGIKIINVSKVFPKQRALSNVSLDVYRGEITVLLGHNGAGKTTLMSIITGTMPATEGTVLIHGVDVRCNPAEARKHVGLCPQHNIFFADLTVLEHVMFFTMLKGGSYSDARSSSSKLVERLGLAPQRDRYSAQLSGGMRRRLQLACALAGGGDGGVLVLDEPTSGLDVETRRGLWDLLLSLRGDRTVVLSTHFMEEADALGDRVAALRAGRLRCLASPLHLKRAVGTGYRLTFTTIGAPKEAAITAEVNAHVPDATVRESNLNSISYNLPAASCDKFPRLFENLEYKRPELGLDSIGVGVSTLEEVFLRLCSDVDTTVTQDDVDAAEANAVKQFVKVTGWALYMRQMRVLIARQFRYMLAKKWWFLLLEVFLPILMVVLTMMLHRNSEKELDDMDQALSLNLSVYETMPDHKVLYNLNDADLLKDISKLYPKVMFEKSTNISEAVLRSGITDILEYEKNLIGVQLNDTNATVLYTTLVRHAAPVALNLLSNLVAAREVPWADGRTVEVTIFPLEGSPHTADGVIQPKSLASTVICLVTVVFILLATSIHAVSLPCAERASGARHNQRMAGAGPARAWAAAALAHAAWAAALAAPAAAAALADNEHTLSAGSFLVTFFLILLLGCIAFIAMAYLVSFYLQEYGSACLLIIILFVFGLIFPLLKSVHEVLGTLPSQSYMTRFLAASSLLVPPHSATRAAAQAGLVARLNAVCALNRDRCPKLIVAETGFDAERCCQSTGDAYCYFCMDKMAPGAMMLCLAVQIVVLMTLVVLTERGVFKMAYEKLINRGYTAPAHEFNDPMVRAERAYVTQAIALPKKQIQDTMLVSNLHKNYHQFFRSCNAVKGISFSIKKGECFGLLGVNGAGKSTTFKMLTGDEVPTRGIVYSNGRCLHDFGDEYIHGIGYCPQFFGLDDFLSGYDNLRLVLTLRGLNEEDVEAEAKYWLKLVELEKYGARLVRDYSGGCVRRLATAVALSRRAALALLDEPSAGVDAAARGRLWRALRARAGAALLSSHSMEEMEALCGRIAILSRGAVCALGSPAALRAAHAAGHALVVKVRAPAPGPRAGDETDSGKSQLNELKGMLHEKFNCTLKDEHKTMLHYHIDETLHYSEMFAALEGLKAAFPTLVEDYSVSETTLEEVFLAFARQQATPPPPPANNV